MVLEHINEPLHGKRQCNELTLCRCREPAGAAREDVQAADWGSGTHGEHFASAGDSAYSTAQRDERYVRRIPFGPQPVAVDGA